jgi:hypothetical protein
LIAESAHNRRVSMLISPPAHNRTCGARFEAQNKHGPDPRLPQLSSYRRRNRRMRGDKLTSTHFAHGHLKAVSP